MKISNVVLKRYTAVIDTNQLDGDVVEVPYEEYKEWWDNNYHCLGVRGYDNRTKQN